MRDDLKNELKQDLNVVNDKINKKENKVRNWNAVYCTGLVGMGYGIFSLDKGKTFAGAIISIGGILIKTIHNYSLINLKEKKFVLECNLNNLTDTTEYNSFDEEDKHFRK